MSLKYEKNEDGSATLTIEIAPEELDKAINKAYNSVKNQISLPGFRRGKVPLIMIEKQYGADIFYDDASEIIVNNTYKDESKECDLKIVSNPEIDIIQVERGKPFIYTARVAVKPEVILGKYKGVEYKKNAPVVEDHEIQKELERLQEMNSRLIPVEDRPAKEGDQCNIDFEGSIDGKLFDGGKAEGHTITLGSHAFIPGFEDQICGHSVGEEFDVNVKFPDDYHSEEVKGKDAVFKVKLNEIKEKELPELDDEFASEISEFETLDEYKEDLKKKMLEEKEGADRKAAEDLIIEKIIHLAEFKVPDLMLKDKTEEVYKDYCARLEQNGLTIEQYLNMVGQKPEDVKKEIEPMALTDLKRRIVLEAVADAEDIQINDEDVETEIAELAKAYSLEPEEFKKIIPEEAMGNLREDIRIARAADFVYDNGIGVEEEENTEEIKEEAADEETAEEKAESQEESETGSEDSADA